MELEKDTQNGNFDPRRRRNRESSRNIHLLNPLDTEAELHVTSKVRLRESTGDEKAMQISSVLSQFQEHLSRPHDLGSLMTTAVWLLKGMLDVEDISVVRFDHDWNGCLMPWQRELFKSKKVNVQKGTHLTDSCLILRSPEDFSAVSDLNTSNCLLKNTPVFDQAQGDAIGLQSALVISIMACKNLWGVVSCINYGDADMDVSFLDREFCYQFAEILSRNVERLEM